MEVTQDHEGVNCNAVMCWAVLLGFSIHGFGQLGVKNMQKIICVLNLHKLLSLLLKQYNIAAAYIVFILYRVLSGDDLMKRRYSKAVLFFYNEIEHPAMFLSLKV